MTLVAYPDHVTDIGKIQNKVGQLHVPTGDIKLSNGMLLKYQQPKEDDTFTRSIEATGMSMDQIPEYGVWLSNDKLKVFASLDNSPHGSLLHVSLSYPKRDPAWGIIKAVRYAFFPADIDVAMMLTQRWGLCQCDAPLFSDVASA
jgi:hypothetical protein